MYNRNWLDLSNKCLQSNSSSNRSHQAQQSASVLRRQEFERAGDGNVPGKKQTKLEVSQTSTHFVREVRLASYPPLKSTPKIHCNPKGNTKKQEGDRQNKTVEPANNHTAPRALCNQQGESEETQRQTSGFSEGDRCPLGGPLHQPLTGCLSTAEPFKPPANTCQKRVPLRVSGGHIIQQNK